MLRDRKEKRNVLHGSHCCRYVCGGAVLFSEWEEWDMLDGSYFCFISLSTIGFGDIVPGGTVYSENIEVSFIVCSMYLMLGMALIAMCFNLMQVGTTQVDITH